MEIHQDSLFADQQPDETIAAASQSDRWSGDVTVRPPDNPYALQETREDELRGRRGDDIGAEQTGLKDLATPQAESDHTPPHRLYELPGARGRIRGSNSKSLPTPGDVQAGLSENEIVRRNLANKLGALQARNLLRGL